MTDQTTLPRPLVTTDWLAANIAAPDLRIVDCSVVMRTTDDGGYTFAPGREEWEQGHIPRSTFVDVQTGLADPDAGLPMMLPPIERFTSIVEALGIGAGTRAVLYDRSNHAWAARVWWMLRTFGYDAAAVLDGGFRKWTAEGREVSTTDETPPAARFEAKLRPNLVASKSDVLAAIGNGGRTVVNALSPDEHAGRQSRFARAGRIAGSCNVYCQSLVDPDTATYLPADEIRARFAAAGVDPAGEVITYCGAGIAASSDALALAILGNERVAVYDGSLSEWTADPDLPMERD